MWIEINESLINLDLIEEIHLILPEEDEVQLATLRIGKHFEFIRPVGTLMPVYDKILKLLIQNKKHLFVF